MNALMLRPYQVNAIERVRAEVRAGNLSVLLVSPTGSGKTVIAADMIRSAVAKCSTLLFLAHRKELIEQCSAKLDALGVDHGVIMADHPRKRPHLPVQVASVQTLIRRLNPKPGTAPSFVPPSLIFVDEAHHARAESYKRILDAFPKSVVVGLTATPWRGDGKGLKGLFTALVVAATVRELTEMGNLVPADGFSYEIPDLSGVDKRGGDYDEGQLSIVMQDVLLSGAMLTQWREHADGKRTVVFAVDVAHSHAIVQEFTNVGVPAEHIDATTHKDVRRDVLERLRVGTTLVVSNVGILTEGWDNPAVEVCVLLRPTKSRSLALQMIGRVLRPWCHDCQDASRPACVALGHAVKTKARIHDHAGVMLEHGMPDDDRDYSLGDDKPNSPSLLRCRKCSVMFSRRQPEGSSAITCPLCGDELTPLTDNVSNGNGAGREILFVDGKQVSMDELRALREDRAAKGLTRQLTPEQLARIKHATRKDKAGEYLRLQSVAKAKGFLHGFVAHQYRETFGVWPRFSEGDLDGMAPAVQPFIPLPRRRL